MQGNIGQLGKVSIHAPHEGERPLSFVPCGLQPHGFNPRSPRGGATKHGVTIQDVARSFNPRSPRGGATMSRCPILSASKFQSTLPTRGSDDAGAGREAYITVSIHAPHEGERLARTTATILPGSVSIHAPHEGERPEFSHTVDRLDEVSIHAPHEGERLMRWAYPPNPWACFNPRSPRGGATIARW